MARIRDLTPQERAVFEPLDRQIPGSNLVGIAEALAERVSRETLGKTRRKIDTVVEEWLIPLQADLMDEPLHQMMHRNAQDRAECMACRVQEVIDRLGEATV